MCCTIPRIRRRSFARCAWRSHPRERISLTSPTLSPNPEQNVNPWGRLLYPVTTLYCMSVSLGQGGAGIGSDINERMVREWSEMAGFRRFRTLPIEDPVSAFFEMRI